MCADAGRWTWFWGKTKVLSPDTRYPPALRRDDHGPTPLHALDLPLQDARCKQLRNRQDREDDRFHRGFSFLTGLAVQRAAGCNGSFGPIQGQEVVTGSRSAAASQPPPVRTCLRSLPPRHFASG